MQPSWWSDSENLARLITSMHLFQQQVRILTPTTTKWRPQMQWEIQWKKPQESENALAQGLQPAVALTARKWRPGRAPSHPYRVNLYQISEGFPPPYPEIQNALNGARCSSRSSNELQKCDMTSNCKKFHCKYTISFRPVFELTSKWMLITPNDLWSRLHKSAKLQKQKLFVFCRLFAKNFGWSPCSG